MTEDVLVDAIADLRALIADNSEAEGCLRTITDAITRVRTLANDWTRMAEYQKGDAPVDICIAAAFKGCANEVRSALASRTVRGSGDYVTCPTCGDPVHAMAFERAEVMARHNRSHLPGETGGRMTDWERERADAVRFIDPKP